MYGYDTQQIDKENMDLSDLTRTLNAFSEEVKRKGFNKDFSSSQEMEIFKRFTDAELDDLLLRDTYRYFLLHKSFGLIKSQFYFFQQRAVGKLNYPEEIGSLFQAVSLQYNCTETISSLIIGKFLGVNPSYMFHRTDAIKQAVAPQERAVKGIILDQDVTLYKSIDVKSISGYTLHVANLYTYKDKVIPVYGDTEQNYGKIQIPQELPNLEYLTPNGNADIYLFLSMKLSWEFGSMNTLDSVKRLSIILTGLLEGYREVGSINLSNLVNRNLVLFCSPDSEEWNHLEKFISRLRSVLCASIKLYPWPIIVNTKYVYPESKREIPVESQVKLHLQETVFNEDSDIESFITSDVRKKAIDVTESLLELHSFETSLGLRNTGGSENRKDSPNTIGDYKFVLDRTMKIQSKPKLHLSARDLFNGNNQTLIWADTHTGKSYFALGLAIGMAIGKPILFLREDTPLRVLYLDGEMRTSIDERISQLSQEYSEYDDLLTKNLRVKLLTRDYLDDKNNVLGMSDSIVSDNINIVIVDNITTLCRSAMKEASDSFSLLTSKLQKNDVGLILIHHSNKIGEAKGSNNLVNLSQNVFALHGAEQIRESYKERKEDIPMAVKDALESEDGTLVNLLCLKNKVSPLLEKRSLYYYLPYDGVWKEVKVDGAGKDKGMGRDTSANDGINDQIGAEEIDHHGEDNDNHPELSENERKILSIIKERGFAKTQDFMDTTGLSDTSCNEISNKLISKGLIKRTGKGSGTAYVLA